jgi:hypothetical protein
MILIKNNINGLIASKKNIPSIMMGYLRKYKACFFMPF